MEHLFAVLGMTLKLKEMEEKFFLTFTLVATEP
jgi:hypothetical protein